MADKVVTIHADKERHLKYGINALVKLEKDMGKSITSLTDDVSILDLRHMFKAGLYWEDRKITDEQVGDLMDKAIEENGLEYLAEALGEAITSSLGASNPLPSKY